MDSQYVYDGLRGLVFKWHTIGWVGQSGPVCNVDLWIRALDLVDRVSATVKWLRVPSHTDIPSNERADVLAEEGRVSSPRYHVLSLPDRSVVSLELPSTPTRRRALAVPRSLELHDVITPSGDTPSLCRNITHEHNDHEMSVISRRLNFLESQTPLISSDDHLSSSTISLKSDASSSDGHVGSRTASARNSTTTVSQGDSHDSISSNSSDTASTASLHDSDVVDDPENT